MAKTIIISDLHGMYDEAIELLDKCKVTASDRVIYQGDLVDRGPDNDKCVDLAMRREKIQGLPACILGNHESVHINHEIDFQKNKLRLPSYLPSIPPTHIATRLQLRPEHHEYFKRLPFYIRLPEYNAVVVHAGVFPGKTIEQQDPHHLLHIQMIDPYDKWGNPSYNKKTMWPSKSPESWKFWTNFWDGPEKIIFGHSVLDKCLITDKVWGIDGGACFGGTLNALILPGWEIVSVKSTRNYGKGKRGRDPNDIRKFLIHGDVSTFS